MNRTEVETCRVDNKSKHFVLSKDLKENEGKDENSQLQTFQQGEAFNCG